MTMLWMPRTRFWSRLRPCVSRNISILAKSKSAIAEHLENRAVLRLRGDETSVFLQGLITNDMRHLEEGARSMYAMFLNTKGRVMYDAIVYRTQDDGTFLVECDKLAVSNLVKHLKMFRVRRNIEIEKLDDLKVWAVFDPTLAETGAIKTSQENKENDVILDCVKERSDIVASRDPRLSVLGVRILVPSSEDVTLQDGVSPNENVNFRFYRYKLGVGEGVNDLPPGNCFPLEANGDYLHGVSFHKGCYIGQELTARTHHTGVVRKRLMPLVFEAMPQTEPKPDAPIQLPNGSNKVALGKLRGVEKNIGLALLRVAEALGVSKLKILDLMAETTKPFWWPQEAPKDRAAAGKV